MTKCCRCTAHYKKLDSDDDAIARSKEHRSLAVLAYGPRDARKEVGIVSSVVVSAVSFFVDYVITLRASHSQKAFRMRIYIK